jgi:predicted nucleic acid-binding protein
LVDKYKKIFYESDFLDLINLTPEVSQISAEIRAMNGIRTPDAIQVGTAVAQKADYFFTNDKRLKSLKEIPVVILEDFI